MSPVAVLYSWFQANKELFISIGSELEFKDSGRGSGYVRLETESYLIELAAWDRAICLDIQFIEVKSEETHFPHTGYCESIEEFENQLNEFLVWFRREAINNA